MFLSSFPGMYSGKIGYMNTSSCSVKGKEILNCCNYLAFKPKAFKNKVLPKLKCKGNTTSIQRSQQSRKTLLGFSFCHPVNFQHENNASSSIHNTEVNLLRNKVVKICHLAAKPIEIKFFKQSIYLPEKMNLSGSY